MKNKMNEMKKMMNEKNDGKEVVKFMKKKKKVCNKVVLGNLLLGELKKDVRFKNMSLDEALDKIESLRKNKESHLSDRAYALFIAYKNGLNVFKKYRKNFVDTIVNDCMVCIDTLTMKITRYNDLIKEFNSVQNIVSTIVAANQ